MLYQLSAHCIYGLSQERFAWHHHLSNDDKLNSPPSHSLLYSDYKVLTVYWYFGFVGTFNAISVYCKQRKNMSAVHAHSQKEKENPPKISKRWMKTWWWCNKQHAKRPAESLERSSSCWTYTTEYTLVLTHAYGELEGKSKAKFSEPQQKHLLTHCCFDWYTGNSKLKK